MLGLKPSLAGMTKRSGSSGAGSREGGRPRLPKDISSTDRGDGSQQPDLGQARVAYRPIGQQNSGFAKSDEVFAQHRRKSWLLIFTKFTYITGWRRTISGAS